MEKTVHSIISSTYVVVTKKVKFIHITSELFTIAQCIIYTHLCLKISTGIFKLLLYFIRYFNKHK